MRNYRLILIGCGTSASQRCGQGVVQLNRYYIEVCGRPFREQIVIIAELSRVQIGQAHCIRLVPADVSFNIGFVAVFIELTRVCAMRERRRCIQLYTLWRIRWLNQKNSSVVDDRHDRHSVVASADHVLPALQLAKMLGFRLTCYKAA